MKEVGGKDEEEVWNPSQPVGLAGAMEDDMLIQLVGQDYRLVRDQTVVFAGLYYA